MAHKPLSPISALAQRRFWQKIRRRGPNECWSWMGLLSEKGYGLCVPYGKAKGQYRAHRIAIFLETGIDPGDFGSKHSCDFPACCNPAHVSPATQAENLADMREKGRDYRFPVISGEYAPHAKLTNAEVNEIRALGGTVNATGYWSERRLAKRFNIAHSQIHRILRGESRRMG